MPAKKFAILTLAFRRDGRRWTGECVELGTATYGRTLQEARAELVELVELHVETLAKTGQRDRFFDAHRICTYGDELAPGEVASTIPVDDEVFIQAHRISLPG